MHIDETKKTVSIIKDEFIQDIIKQISETPLPLFVIEYILKDILSEIHIASRQQLEADKAEYQKQLDELNNTNNKDKNLP